MALQSTNEELKEENRDVRSRAAEYEQGYMNLLSELEELKQKSQAEKAELLATTEAHAESADNQALYELESRLKAAEADKEVAEQDADRLQKELNALEVVLHDFQATSKAQVRFVRVHVVPDQRSIDVDCYGVRIRVDIHQKEQVAALETALEEAKQAQKMTKSAGVQEDDDFERVMTVLAKKTRECDQLREVRVSRGDASTCLAMLTMVMMFVLVVQALESATNQYSTERDVLDKRLAAQLVVCF